jgi:AIPR protein
LAAVYGSIEPLETKMKASKQSFPILKAAHWQTTLSDAEARDPNNLKFKNWVLWVRAGDLPVDLPLDPNARRPDTSTKTPQAIKTTLQENPEHFVRLNSGITIVARDASVDPTKPPTVQLWLDSCTPEEEEEGKRGDGVLNGGHTYAVIKEVLAEYEKDPDRAERKDPRDAVVRVEVQTGISEDQLAAISRARNTSTPVQEYSIKNLGQAWAGIKKVLPLDIRKRVAFLENDPEATDNSLDLDVGDLVKLLALFSPLYPPGKKDPIAAYQNEKALVARWKPEQYVDLIPHLPDFIKLHDMVGQVFAKKVMQKAGKVDGVRLAPKDRPFILLSGMKSKHLIPPSFTFPVLAALRVFFDNGRWLVPMEKLISDPQYVEALCEYAYEQYREVGRSRASYFGRNKQVWRTLCLMTLLKKNELLAA